MFAFAKQLVKNTADGIIQNASAAYESTSSSYNSQSGSSYSGRYPQDQSQGGSNQYYQQKKADLTHGFRVLHVKQGSAAEMAGLQPLFDFIVGINGHDIVAGSQSLGAGYYNQGIQDQQGYQQNYHQPQQGAQGSQSSLDYQNQHTQPSALSSNPYAPSPSPSQLATNSYQYQPSNYNNNTNAYPGHSYYNNSGSPIEPFLAEIANCRGRSICLEVWSSKGRVLRNISIAIPGDDLDSNSNTLTSSSTSLPQTQSQTQLQSSSPSYPSLGASLQWTPLSVADHVWHVLNVSPNSPAEIAGLISHSDYIVGAEGGLLEQGGEDLLGRVITRLFNNHLNSRMIQQSQMRNNLGGISEENENGGLDDDLDDEFDEKAFEKALQEEQSKKVETIVNSQPELELYVYNHDYNTLRPVRIRPRSNWGGSGLLGCGVGYGLLHRLPAVTSMSSQGPPPAVSSSNSPYGPNTNTTANNNFDNAGQNSSNNSGIYNPVSGYQQALPPGSTLFDSDPSSYQDQYQSQFANQNQYANYNQQQQFEQHPEFQQQNSGFGNDSSNFFVPANAPPMAPPPTFPLSSSTTNAQFPAADSATLSSGLVHASKKKHGHHHTGAGPGSVAGGDGKGAIPNDLAAYFEEEEQKSKELEGYVKEKVDPSLPPPPTAAGFGK